MSVQADQTPAPATRVDQRAEHGKRKTLITTDRDQTIHAIEHAGQHFHYTIVGVCDPEVTKIDIPEIGYPRSYRPLGTPLVG